ncbi:MULTISPECIES: hypothetical protein [unclassified Xanthobacter]|uniref:hypothetical protein n=1 Tax=Xanthobacter TaxID=279 RepID=UPI001F44A87E|nr:MULTISPECIES: hypothetical protein [unclassified Xanthobacter]
MSFRNPILSRRGALRAALSATTCALGPAAALRALTGPARAAEDKAAPLGVTVRNQSTAPSCNGPENVALTLVSPQVRRFRVEARHPAYVHTLVTDHSVPAYLACPPAPAAATASSPKPATARRVTLHETPELTVVGYVLPDAGRRAEVPFRVAEAATPGLDKVELWLKPAERGATVIELFLADGSWRLRPLPPPPLATSAFSASVLVGPVAQEERLLVKLKEVGFAPQARAFTLHFADGGSARVHLAGLDTESLALEAEFSDGLTAPFAAVRAHYAVESEADITRVAWRTASSAPFGEAPVMSFDDASDVTLLWAGRLAPARPALTAPDLVFTGFTGA